MPRGGSWLVAAGWGSVLAALLHLSCIVGGPAWYRFFGAPGAFAEAAGQGKLYPVVVTAGIAAILFGWAIWAFSAAGKLPRVPLLRTGLVLICAVCLLRSTAMLFPYGWLPEHSQTFRIVSSLVVLALGICFSLGTLKTWPSLSTRSSPHALVS